MASFRIGIHPCAVRNPEGDVAEQEPEQEPMDPSVFATTIRDIFENVKDSGPQEDDFQPTVEVVTNETKPHASMNGIFFS